ncbi:MAG TPA: leucyl aminopeptidase, partial [Candidatus Binatia bacterium]|nr:leucyl aminopeptidase [Candidatus Binatia bacterium]
RAALVASGFEAGVGETLVLPRVNGPTMIEFGLGTRADLDATALRDAVAAVARAAVKHEHIVVDLSGVGEVSPATVGQATVEGALLARYRYRAFRDSPREAHLRRLTIVVSSARAKGTAAGAARGEVTAAAVNLARDLDNTPATHLTARRFGELAERIGRKAGLEVEVFDEDALVALGCGGLLGVNAGSAEPARMIKLTYKPKGRTGGRSRGHLALVGKGIMYDAGGISLKPSDAMHAAMKLDMSGSAAVFGAMTTLRDLDCKSTVTGYLMCTDNMPSGTATRLGDVLTIHGGKTVEVINADAEGHLVMADAVVLAAEDKADAIVTIATLTGAALRTFGTALAATLGNDQALVEQVKAAAATTDEPVWQLPLVRKYRRKLDSSIADIKNMGGENAGTITAGLFLDDFTAGTPWAHLDICGPMMSDTDDSWRPIGATAFGTRLLAELALAFKPTR